jgi:TRAP-type C4-dicarboxylate transport system substrate-binding protein
MGIFAIEKGAFAALAPADQQVVREVMGRVVNELDDAARADDKRAAEVLTSSGLQTVPVNAADVDAWRRAVEGIYPDLRARPNFNGALFDELLSVLADYRRSHPEATPGAH